tara:strand:- start:724 stop:930 length:207 start_codon:yes stop_codon:yes gene_type:complete
MRNKQHVNKEFKEKQAIEKLKQGGGLFSNIQAAIAEQNKISILDRNTELDFGACKDESEDSIIVKNLR